MTIAKNMSSEFSIDDFASLVSLAKRIRSDYTDAPQEFHKACLAAGSIQVILEVLQHDFRVRQSPLWQDKQSSESLVKILSNCAETLRRLEEIISRDSTFDKRAWKKSWHVDSIDTLFLIQSDLLYYISCFSVLQDSVGLEFLGSVLGVGFQEVVETIKKFAENARASKGEGSRASHDNDESKIWNQFHLNLIKQGCGSQQIFENEEMVMGHLATMSEQGILDNDINKKIGGNQTTTIDRRGSFRTAQVAPDFNVGIQALSTMSIELSKLLQERESYEKILVQKDENLRRRDGYISTRESEWANQALLIRQQEDLHASILKQKDQDIRARDDALASQACDLHQQKELHAKALTEKDKNAKDREEFDTKVSYYEKENRELQLKSNNFQKTVEKLQKDLDSLRSEYANLDDEKNLLGEVINGRAERVRLFLAKGANANTFNSQTGLSALHEASQYGHTDVASMLLDRGADIEVRNKTKGRTPLHMAAFNGREAVVRLLLDRGARITETCNERWTPLHEAAKKGHLGVVQLLLKKGANVNAKTNANLTALDMARSNGREDVAQLLLEKTGFERM